MMDPVIRAMMIATAVVYVCGIVAIVVYEVGIH